MKKIKYNYIDYSIKTKEGKKGKKKNCSECKIITIGQILIQQYHHIVREDKDSTIYCP